MDHITRMDHQGEKIDANTSIELYKVIKCPVYTYVRVPGICEMFLDTPIFQRLGRIKQLGPCHYVYPSAVHTRKEHSLGVMHLTGLAIDHLRYFVTINRKEKELIQLDALYHDIGHLAYSHMFDDFLHRFDVKTLDQHYSQDITEFFNILEHELRSVYLLRAVNDKFGSPLNSEEIEFVSNVILGKKPDHDDRYYIYELVNNVECGIDTDKMDYLYRDSYHTGLPNFQPFYIINSMVIDKDNHIAFKSKAKIDIDDLFRTRHRMFEQVYKHHTVKKICRIYKCRSKKSLKSRKSL